MDQGYRNLAWECVCLDDARLVKVKQLLMSWRCMPADMKNLVCWPKGSKGCWLWKLKACDYSLKHAALCMMSYLHMTRTSTLTSRQWSCTRTASAVRLRDRNGQRKMAEGEVGDQSEMWTAQSSVHPINFFDLFQLHVIAFLTMHFSFLKLAKFPAKSKPSNISLNSAIVYWLTNG